MLCSAKLRDIVKLLLRSSTVYLVRRKSCAKLSAVNWTTQFNEQYLVKPPHSSEATFPWHRDRDMLPGEVPPYVSAWIALDDVCEVCHPFCLPCLPTTTHSRKMAPWWCYRNLKLVERYAGLCSLPQLQLSCLYSLTERYRHAECTLQAQAWRRR